MATIINQASATYTYGAAGNGVASSNVATTELRTTLSAIKSALPRQYRGGERITYLVSVTNSGATQLTNVTVRDNLGGFTPAGGAAAVTPLTYTGPAYLFINGGTPTEITPTVEADGLTFTVPALAAGANAIIEFDATVNDFAPLAVGEEINNVATVTADGINEPVEADETITAEEYADLAIVKTMAPNPVVDGGTITYTFVLYNYGNAAAENVVLSDTFNPAPTGITVTRDGVTVAPDEYNYVGGTLTLPAGTGTPLTVPAATITVDPLTGRETVTPSSVTVVVTGTV